MNRKVEKNKRASKNQFIPLTNKILAMTMNFMETPQKQIMPMCGLWLLYMKTIFYNLGKENKFSRLYDIRGIKSDIPDRSTTYLPS